MRQYRECRRILRDELDVNPSPQTQALYQQLQNNQLQPPQSPAAHSNRLANSHIHCRIDIIPHARSSNHKQRHDQWRNQSLTTPNLFADELRFVTLLCIGFKWQCNSPRPVDRSACARSAGATGERFAGVGQRRSVALSGVGGAGDRRGNDQLLFGATATHEDDAERALQVCTCHLTAPPTTICCRSALGCVSAAWFIWAH